MIVGQFDWITSEYSLFQYLTSLLFFVSFPLIFASRLDRWLKGICGLGMIFLSVDELMMFHECVKMSRVNQGCLRFLPDPVFILYLLGALFVFVVLYFQLRDVTGKVKGHIFGILVCGLVSLSIDFDWLAIGPIGDVIEEVGEAGVALGLIGFWWRVSSPSRLSVRRVFVQTLVGFVLWFSLAAGVQMLRQGLCPKIYLIPRLQPLEVY